MVFRKLTSDEERFWGRVDLNGPVPRERPELGPCWLWLGSKIRGYGQFPVGSRTDGSRKMLKAHRFAFTVVRGPIPDRLPLDHQCDNPPCVRPSHLEPVTPRANVLRNSGPTARNARKTTCARGHQLTGDRRCRECLNQNMRTYRERHPDRARAAWQASNAKRRSRVAG